MAEQKLLKKLLKELLPRIKGDYFISDGALLGIIREGNLLEHDNDIDIYLLPNTTIDLEDTDLKIQKYYMNDKIYNPNYSSNTKSKWLEYISYIRTKLFPIKYNKPKLYKLGSLTYKTESIKNNATTPNIDIFYLEKKEDTYIIPYWTNKLKYYYYKHNEIYPLLVNNDLGVGANIPYKSITLLKRFYGENCLSVIDKEFLHL